MTRSAAASETHSAAQLRIERGRANAEERAAVLLVIRRRRADRDLVRWRLDRIAALRRLPRG